MATSVKGEGAGTGAALAATSTEEGEDKKCAMGGSEGEGDVVPPMDEEELQV